MGNEIALVGAYGGTAVQDRDCAVVAGLLDRHVLLGFDEEVRLRARVERKGGALVERHAAEGVSGVRIVRAEIAAGIVVSATKRDAVLGRNRAVLGSSADIEIIVGAERDTALLGLHRLAAGKNDVAALRVAGDCRPVGGDPSIIRRMRRRGLVVDVVINDFVADRIRERVVKYRRRVCRVENYVASVVHNSTDLKLGVVADCNGIVGIDIHITVHPVLALKRHLALAGGARFRNECGATLDDNLAFRSGRLGYVAVLSGHSQIDARIYLIEFNRVAVNQGDRGSCRAYRTLEVVVGGGERNVGSAGVKHRIAFDDNTVRRLGNGAICCRDNQVAIVGAAGIRIVRLYVAKHDAAGASAKRNIVAFSIDLRSEDTGSVVDRYIIVGRTCRVLGVECRRTTRLYDAVERYVILTCVDREKRTGLDFGRRHETGGRRRRDATIRIKRNVARRARLHLAARRQGNVALDGGVGGIFILCRKLDVLGRLDLLFGHNIYVAVKRRHINRASLRRDVGEFDRVAVLERHGSATRGHLAAAEIVIIVGHIHTLSGVCLEVGGEGLDLAR